MPARKKPSSPAPAPPAVPVETVKAELMEKVQAMDRTQALPPSVVAEMMVLIPPSVIAEQIQSLLTATRWVGKGKHAREEPDYRAREIGLRYWFSYGIGLPVQRIEQINTTVESESQLMERAKHSPATRRHLRAELDRMEAEDGVGAS